jgi:hypothetical protein
MGFSDFSELLACVEHLSSDAVRARMSSEGRRYADSRYGDQQAFVDGVVRALGVAVPNVR